jgi:pyrimidine 5'-nucleotidase
MTNFTTIFFDLDDTLYPRRSGLWDAIGNRIDEFIHTRLHIPCEDIPELRHKLFEQYGTTMRGLVATYGVNQQEYMDFVHDLPLRNFIAPNPLTREMLLKIPLQKFIFTNADVHHARRVLDVLNYSDIFSGIIDINDIDPYCKPMPGAYPLALEKSGEADADHCIMIDDRISNLVTASQTGMYTIWIGEEDLPTDVHARIESIDGLAKILDTMNIYTS